MSHNGAPSGRRVQAYAYTLVTTGIVLLFALGEWATVRYLAERSRAASTVVEIIIVLAAALAFRPIHAWIESRIAAAFTKRKREAAAALAKLRRELPSYGDMAQLLRRVIETLETHCEANACAVYLRRELFHAEASSFDLPAQDVDLSDPLAVRLRSSTAPAKPSLLQSNARGTHAFPMTSAGELVGFLCLHRKHGDYDEEETAMLAGVAVDLAAAALSLDPALRMQKGAARGNIPADLPLLVGRDREIAEIRAALAASRLVTVTGPGGVGKTALALHCASEAAARHEHGAWFVNLAPIVDPALIPAAIVSALGAGSKDAGLDELIGLLRARNCLLVIDNCEQVVDGAAKVIAHIRAQCAQVSILTTSRELLRLSGEQVYRLGSLASAAAVELFAQRAAAVSPEFDARDHGEVVRSLCEHLDGIPLAIELAAARCRALSVEETLAHLNERFKLLRDSAREADPRQQTLAATIAWSYDLLSDEERSLLRRLSVFRGTFSLAAAAAVCAQGGVCDEYHILDVLTSLVDKSLLSVQVALTSRYHLLETIREFAVQRAAERDEGESVSHQHAAYFSEAAAHAYFEFDSRLPQGWLARLAPDIDNFRCALEWTLDGQGNREDGAHLCADCGPVFLRMQLLTEWLKWYEAAKRVGAPPAVEGRLHYVASMIYNNLVQLPNALTAAERALALYRQTADRRGIVRALSQLAQQYAQADRFDEAAPLAEEAVRAGRELGEPRVLAGVLRRCAHALSADHIERARELFEEALRLAKESREPEEASRILQWWASRESSAGCFERARQIALQGLPSAGPAEALFLESLIAMCAVAEGSYDDALPHARRALDIAAQLDHPIMFAIACAYCAPALSSHDPKGAANVFGFAKARLAECDWAIEGETAVAFASAEREIRASQEAGMFAALTQEGAAWSREQVVERLTRSTDDGNVHAPANGGRRVDALLG